MLQEKRQHSHVMIDWKRQELLKNESYHKLEEMKKLHDIAPEMLKDWTKNKTTQKHASWLHEDEFKK